MKRTLDELISELEAARRELGGEVEVVGAAEGALCEVVVRRGHVRGQPAVAVGLGRPISGRGQRAANGRYQRRPALV